MLHPFLIQKFATYNLTSFLEGVYTEASELRWNLEAATRPAKRVRSDSIHPQLHAESVAEGGPQWQDLTTTEYTITWVKYVCYVQHRTHKPTVYYPKNHKTQHISYRICYDGISNYCCHSWFSPQYFHVVEGRSGLSFIITRSLLSSSCNTYIWRFEASVPFWLEDVGVL